MANISSRHFLLLLACAAAMAEIVRAIHDPAYTGIKTKTYRRDPIIAQAFEQQQQEQTHEPHSGRNHQATTNFDANERLSSTASQHNHNNIQYHQSQSQQQQQQLDQQGGYYQQQEVPLYQRNNYQERHGPPTTTQQAVSSSWGDAENAITEYYTGCPAHHTGQLPYAYDCRRFVNCWNGRGHIQSCAPGTVFNPDTLECDRPEKVVCGSLLALGDAQATKRTARYRAGHHHNMATENVELLCPPGGNGLHPHPTDCTKFLNCANGNVHVQSCGPGTAYSIPMEVCDYKHKVDCGTRGGNAGTTVVNSYNIPGARDNYGRSRQLSEGTAIACPPGAAVLHPHPFDCTKFLNCAHGIAEVQACGPGTAFDSVNLVCDFKDKVNCGGGERRVGLSRSYAGFSSNQGSAVVDILCPANVTGLFPHPFDYTKFLNCKNGNTAIQNCMSGMIFSISKRYCDTKETILYNDHVSYIVSEVRYEYSQQLTSCPPGTDGLHLYPFDCGRYLKCANGQMLILECAPGQVFSISRRTCLSEQHVSVSDRMRYYREIFEEVTTTSTYAQMQSHNQQHMLQCPNGVNGLFPFPFDATKYITCDVNGKLLIETCSSGSVFSLSRKQCNLRQEVRRNDMVQLHGAVNYGEELSQQGTYGYNNYGKFVMYLVCPAHLNGYFLHPFDCTKYIECLNGETKIEICGSGTVYSISRKLCISRDQVEAFDRVEYLTETQHEFSTENDQHFRETGSGMLVQCSPNANGLHSHPYDYTKYLKCTQGRTVVENCPAGMMFSIPNRNCDYEDRVNSNDRSTYARGNVQRTDIYQNQGTTTITSYPNFQDNNAMSCPIGVSGLYPHTRDCTKYLNCVNGVTHVLSCGPGTAWDPQMQVCELKQKVNCAGRSSMELSNEFASSAQRIICPSAINGFYPHSFDYTKYIICQDGRTVVQKCLEGKVFSMSMKKCVLQAEVEASDRVRESWAETDLVMTQHAFYISCPPEATGSYIYPFDCTKFIKCENGQTIVESCVRGKIFSLSKQWCTLRAQVSQADRVSFLNETQSVYSWESKYGRGSGDFSCPVGVSGLYQHPYNWTQYLNCVNGRTILESCGRGKVFSISKRVCEAERKVAANDRCNNGVALTKYDYEYSHKQPSVSHTTTVKHRPLTACAPNETGMKPHPSDCTKFLNCGSGVANVQDCAAGTAWNIELQVCDFLYNVDCSDRGGSSVRKDSSITTTRVNEFGGSEGSSVTCPAGVIGIYPHPLDCTKFLNCANGITYIQACGPGTAWNGALQVCDFIANVDCSALRHEWSAQNEHNYNNRGGKSYGGIGDQNNQWGHEAGARGDAWSHHQQAQGHVLPTDNQQTTYTMQNYYPHSQGQHTSTTTQTQNTAVRDRWTDMNVARPGVYDQAPAGASTWSDGQQQSTNRNYPNSPNPSWSGTGTSIHTATPSQSVLYEEGSLQPNRDYAQTTKSYAVPLAPFASNTGSTATTTTTNLYYAQPVGSQEDSREAFNSGTYGRTDNTYMQTPTTSAQNFQHNRRNSDREINYQSSTNQWNPNSRQYNSEPHSHPFPNQNLMPPRQDDSQLQPHQQGTAFHMTHTQTHSYPTPNQQLMTPYQENTEMYPHRQDTNTHTNAQPIPNQNLMPPPQDGSQLYPQQQRTAFHMTHTQTHSSSTPNQQLMPPHRDNTQMLPHQQDIGQRPLEESEFGLQSVIMDDNAGQYDISAYDHYPTSTQISNTIIRSPPSVPSSTAHSGIHTQRNHNQQAMYPTPLNISPQPPVADESNLFGGMQPPLPTAAEPYAAAPQTYLQPPTYQTRAMNSERTIAPFSNNDFLISNASVKKFVRDPHYSPSYAGVAHSRNTTWGSATKSVPQHNPSTNATSNTGIKGVNGPSNALIAESNDDFSDTTPTYRSISTPFNSREYHASTISTRFNGETDIDGKDVFVSDALRMLLRPYFNRSGTVSEDTAAQAESYIMNLASTTTTPRPTTTAKKSDSKPTQLVVPDVELILAGEQHSLATVRTQGATAHQLDTELHEHKENTNPESKPNWHKHEHSRDFHHRHPHLPNPFTNGETPNVHTDPLYSPHPDRHHNHHRGHSREFHLKNPHLPNPFPTREGDKSVVEADIHELPNPNAESTTVSSIDLRGSFADQDCQFDCGNGKCVKTFEICDGVNNCGNRKDESNCDHLGYEVRLTGGESTNMGRIEVSILGKWGYICDDKFGLRDADVVCRELGFKLGASEVRGNSYYPPTEVNFAYTMDEVDCRGNETALKDCDFPGWGVNNCGPDEVVGVVCKVPLLKCPNNYWLCSTSKECIPPAFVCDNTPDCADESDESERVCNSTIEYRLEGGRSANEGRLEVKFRGEWGTVCDDDFGLKEAQVLCNFLGYYGTPKIEKNIFGPGSGPIWLDQVSCIGNETAIDKCHHWIWGEHNCNHTEDVGIRCTAGPPPRTLLQTINNRKADDDQQAADDSQLALMDIGLYSMQWERSSKFLSTQRRCGHFKRDLIDEFEHPEERVVNGSVSKRGRHPWQATIRTRGRGGISSHWCGAVLISKKHLLTAAHCLAGYPKGAYFIRMGDHYANIAESSEVDSYIENWYIHEKFRDKTHMNNDIALIVLKNPVRFNDYIQPICLPDKGISLKENRLCTISGWGSIKSGVSTPSNILRSAQLPILEDAICKQSHVYGTTMTEGMFCAGFMDESVDACDGDSGGPFVCSDSDGETLYGIISWGQHCGYANKPGVYVRVEKYIDWIYEKINFSMQQGRS